MKKIININLSARLIPIEDSAYEILRQYLESLRRHFSKEEGAEEIQSDIESRIAELFHDKLKNGAHCITDEDVQTVITSIGRPEQFEGSDESSGQTPPADDLYSRRPRKRLYRDPDTKVLGGVCGGLGNYFSVDPVIFRIIFALLAIGGFGTGVLVYFILWVATPEANTAAEKLEMRGERVDLNNIKTTIQEEISQIKGNVGKVGDDIKNFTYGRGRQVGNGIERFFHSLVDILGKTLILVTKGIFFFLAVVILFCLIIAAVAIAASSAAIFPFKEVMLEPGLQTALIWPVFALLLGIPIVALVIFIVRKITGIKQSNRFVGASLGILWLIGVVCTICLAVSIVKDFRAFDREKENITLKMPSQGKLIVKQQGWQDDENMHFMMGDLIVDEDTVVLQDAVEVRTESSRTGNFEVEVQRSSRGHNLSEARRLAQEIAVNLRQEDSILYIPRNISIPKGSHFRVQDVKVIIYVPEGKSVDLQDTNNHYHHIRINDENDNDDNDDDTDVNIDSDGNGGVKIETHHHGNSDSLHENFRYHSKPAAPKEEIDSDTDKQRTPVDNSKGTSSTPQIKVTSVMLYGLYNLFRP
ncbi:phage shock protein C (PspC) family protein [Chitinophaga costaii]|uniref:Phage shock protein C (PspC) family protein n=1 Tax=Chitinophaga costaii TaxID=1335309 RepID=A0A1C4AFR4_9BACT|nr:PspC domain-containing protein [Chitinophaga costaii]PUZ26586.1 PspC domain-containing protein [Chitinophaga costaii]SCB93395.1 phage shock protein C (PspC) family protein [Chitinophaga costaii]